MYYHASQTAGIRRLEPRTSNHGTPLVYFSSKRENVLVYLSNAVEKYARETGMRHDGPWMKWGPYGFTRTGLLRLDEYYPNALEDVYKGVSAYIYSADVPEGLKPLDGIPDAYASEKPVPVTGCEYVPDAYAAILHAHANGRIAICRYEDMTQDMREWLRKTIVGEYNDNVGHEDYRRFLWAKFPFLHELREK